MTHPLPHPADRPVRLLFVFAWLAVGGEETMVRLLARSLDPARYRIDVLPCLRLNGVSDLAHRRLEAAGVRVDRTAYDLSFEDTVRYLERKLAGCDIVVSCQNVPDIYPALDRLSLRPPLIEHGRLVSDALAGPKHFTTRHVGACGTIRDAAASRMADRPQHAHAIPAMVDMAAFDPARRGAVRASLGLPPDALLIGWVGRLDRRRRVEDFLRAAALTRARHPRACFVVVGGPDAEMPDHATELRLLAERLGLSQAVLFTGDRADVPDLLGAMDIFVRLSRSEGMPHVVAEAGAARLPVIATAGHGAPGPIRDGENGLLVPHDDIGAIAAAMGRLACDPALRRRLGNALHRDVAATHAATAVVRRWEALFDEVLATTPAPPPLLFRSFVQGGFESSAHRLHTGRRLDVIAATGHDTHAEGDYRQLAGMGLRTVRDAARWHLIERQAGRHDFSSFLPMVRAARQTGTQVIWDLLHYGWPDDLDIWTPAFVDRFAAFARATARALRDTTDEVPFWCPVNEISFFSWAGGDARYLNPFAAGRGYELKVQLARASIAAMHALRDVDPRARFVHCEPLIAIHHDPALAPPRWEAEGWHQAQFQAFELLMGRLWPQIGGDPSLLDIVGVNYYSNNQWIHGGPPIDVDHPLYRPLSDLLFETHARYGRPIFLSETGVEGDRRAPWLRHVAAEVTRARRRGVPVEGICLYPVMNHPGWDDDRACQNGLLTQQMEGRQRGVDAALAAAVADVVADAAARRADARPQRAAAAAQ
ncbi:glycosyltransferase family 4 protein [Paracoccaceae bacterium Fryx2]|nr:glycosyltransferase family 4 protein [Paracoccaceae bacterium Fryx2]